MGKEELFNGGLSASFTQNHTAKIAKLADIGKFFVETKTLKDGCDS